jgi:hypothetical protein
MPKEKALVLEYDNIMIYTDLSNRLEKGPNDTMVINQITNFFVTDCVRPGFKVSDRSSISFSRINTFKSNCSTAKIDIGEIGSLKEKQRYVNDKSETTNLSFDIHKFKETIVCNYKEKDESGLDILSLLYNEINSGNHIKKPTFINGEDDTTKIVFYNHLFLFTDGYLEYNTKSGSSDFYFSQPQIEKVREYCKTNKIAPDEAIKNNPDFKLRPLKSENNKYVRLYIMETYDRGLNEQKGTLKNTGDLSDNNILRLVWQTWASESGFKGFIWKQMTKPSSLPKDYIKAMIIR